MEKNIPTRFPKVKPQTSDLRPPMHWTKTKDLIITVEMLDSLAHLISQKDLPIYEIAKTFSKVFGIKISSNEMRKLIQQYKDGIDKISAKPSVETSSPDEISTIGPLEIKNIIKTQFKVLCAKEKISMTDAILSFIKESITHNTLNLKNQKKLGEIIRKTHGKDQNPLVEILQENKKTNELLSEWISLHKETDAKINKTIDTPQGKPADPEDQEKTKLIDMVWEQVWRLYISGRSIESISDLTHIDIGEIRRFIKEEKRKTWFRGKKTEDEVKVFIGSRLPQSF